MIRHAFAVIHTDIHGLADASAALGTARPKALKHWLESLPIAHPAGATEQLDAKIDAINTARLRPGHRLALLRCLEPTAEQLLEQLHEGYRQAAHPLSDAEQQQLQLAMVVLEGLVRGYRLAHQDSRPGSRTARAATARVLHYCGLALQESHFTHMTPPPGLWRLIHEHGLERGIRDSETRYRQLLLAAASNPWGLTGTDVLGVYHQAERLAPRLRLSTGDDASRNKLAIAVGRDAGPMPAHILGGGDEEAVTLDTRNVLKALQRELRVGTRRWPWGRPLSANAQRQLEAIQTGLDSTLPRQYSRRSTSGEAELVAGLTRIHRTLSGGAVPPQVAEFQARNLTDAHTEADVWNLIFPAEELIEKYNVQDPREPGTEERPATRESAPTAHWQMIDRSAGGYRVWAEQLGGGPLRVGELVLIREHLEGQELAWELGVMRWLRHHHGEQLEAGVQVISPRPEPIQMRGEGADGRLTHPFAALVTPAIPRLGSVATVLLPPLELAPGRPVWLQTARGPAAMTLRECMERQAGFCRYTFTRDSQSAAS